MDELKRLIPFVKPYWRRAIVLALFAFGALISGLVEPYFLGQTVDRGISQKNMNAVALYGGLLLASALSMSIFNYLKSVWQGTIGTDVVRDLRNMLYRKLQYLPFSWYTTMPTGQIMSRMISDMDSIEQFVAFGFVTMLTEGSNFTFTFIILMTLDWQLTLAILIPMPLMIYAIVRFRMKIDPAWAAVREQMGRLTTVLQENIAGVRVVKAFAREPHAMTQFDEQNELNRSKNVARAKLEASAFPMMDFVSGLCFLMMISVGAIRLVNGSLTLGTYFSFTWYVWSLIWPVRITGWLVSIMRQAAASVPRLFAIADAPVSIGMPEPGSNGAGERGRGGAEVQGSTGDEEIHPLSPSPMLSGLPARVTFDNVSFAFPDDLGTPVLQGLSFDAEPGQTVAIMGGTGSGKSSVINLVPRFYDVTGGRVLIDGVDVREMQVTALRGQVGIVPQETFLFSAMLKDNIAFGRPDASLEQIIEAAKVAQVDEFARLLPKGYDTKVGERGVGLSGGQKQRVALARAVLMNPRILILDEATSAVDTGTELAIQDAMARVLKGRTALIVAQRLSTIQNADKIVVLREGRVAEEGTHAELLALGGEYTKLYELQFREQEERKQDLITEEGMLVE